MKFQVLKAGLYGAVAGVPLVTIGFCNVLKTGSWDIAFPCVVGGVVIPVISMICTLIGNTEIKKDDFER